jgi:hypothetical protein
VHAQCNIEEYEKIMLVVDEILIRALASYSAAALEIYFPLRLENKCQ